MMPGALSGLLVVWSIHLALFQIPKFAYVYNQVDVAMPFLTTVVIRFYIPLTFALLLMAGVCIWKTCVSGYRPSMVVINVLCLAILQGWLVFCQVGLFIPLLGLLEGIN